ncbi:MAG: hypothetical protein GY832_20110 [Chloroflexi bacterium]|nr:hypothetical protein [Chloroflexota bacterium]
MRLLQAEAEKGLVFGLVCRHGEPKEDVLKRIVNLPVSMGVHKIGDVRTRELFEVILENADKGLTTSIELAAKMIGMDEFEVATATASVDPDALEVYAGAVSYWHKKRMLETASIEARQAADALDPEEALDVITDTFTNLKITDEEDAVKTVRQASDEAHEHLMQMHDDIREGRARVCFPWPKLNSLIPFLLKGDVVLWTAKSKVGKSSTMQQLFDYNARRGFTGVMFHLEDTPLKIYIRRIARHMTQLVGDVRYAEHLADQYRMLAKNQKGETGIPLTDKEIETILVAKERVDEELGDSFEIHCPGWTAEQIARTITRLNKQLRRQRNGDEDEDRGIDFVMIDYVNKLAHSEEYEIGVGQANALARDLETFKTVTERLGFITFVVQQENDEGRTYNSRATYHKAQGWISAQRERLDDQTLSLKGKFVVKAANFGETGAVDIELIPRWMVWKQI